MFIHNEPEITYWPGQRPIKTMHEMNSVNVSLTTSLSTR